MEKSSETNRIRAAFSYVIIEENCQKTSFFNICRLFQENFIRLHKQKSGLGFVMLIELLEKAVESFSGYARFKKPDLAKALFGCRAFFFNFFCLSLKVTTAISTWKFA